MPEARVLRQLVEALLFERIVPWSARRPRTSGAGDELTFALGSRVYVCNGKSGAFGRVRLAPRSIRRLESDSTCRVRWEEILDGLPSDPRTKAEIAEELANTERFCQWNLEHARGESTRREQSYEELESSLHEGHLYHPCFKARTGFSLDDHRLYGPEARRTFALCWLAVDRARLREALPVDEARFWREELGEDVCRELDRARDRTVAPPAQYGILPVHPWQWQRLRQKPAVQAALARRELVDLELSAGEYRATQSLRTLLCASDSRRAHLKLPLDVRVSSSVRLLAPESVSAAPAISAWLKELVASDPFFSSGIQLCILSERAGSFYVPARSDADLDGQLALIVRESIGQKLGRMEAAVPFNALLVDERDGRPFIDHWLARHGVAAWLERLLEVAVLPVFRLLVHHGVAVEAHAQNMILIHRDGWPERLALRDFHDSVEYVPSYLADPSRAPNFPALHERFENAPLDSAYAMSSIEELRELFMDTVFVFNLSELSHLVERHYAFAEGDFWCLAERVLESYTRSAWGDARRAALLGHRAPRVRAESLFRQRLVRGAPIRHHHWISNALYGSSRRISHARYR